VVDLRVALAGEDGLAGEDSLAWEGSIGGEDARAPLKGAAADAQAEQRAGSCRKHSGRAAAERMRHVLAVTGQGDERSGGKWCSDH
jgi:hypothetical protein